MIIGIDGNEANVEKKVGVSVYTFELLHYFHTIQSKDDCFIIYLKNQPKRDLPKENDFFKYRIVSGNFLWSQLFLPLHLYLKQSIDIFFSPAHYAPRLCPVPTVVTIHDLSYLYYPEDFLKKDLYQLKNWTKYSIEKTRKIIAVSKNTQKDLMKWYHVPENKIDVIYNGYTQVKSQIRLGETKVRRVANHRKAGRRLRRDPVPRSGSQTTPYAGIPSAVICGESKVKSQKPYILYIGTLQPRKNIATLIDAFHLLLKEKPEYSLIIAGKKGWLYEKIFDQVQTLNLEDKITFTGYVSDEEKATLYTDASLFVLPSLYEGFGIPLLEAMSFGCPVISSFTSSLPEIGGDACLYFDPKKPDELKEKMMEIIENKSLSQELIQKAKKRVQLFSWKKCGKQTLDSIRNTYER